ncbi:unnamed protein product, partial [Ectocarpus sp. 12 AP-2014]
RGWHPGWWPPADSSIGRWSESIEAGEARAGGRREDGEEEKEEDRGVLDDKEPMPECFRSLPVVITPVVLSLIRAAAAQKAAASPPAHSSPKSPGTSKGLGLGQPSRSSQQLQQQQPFGAYVEEAMLQSVASQLRLATRIGHGDHAWAPSDASELSDSHCLRYPRLRYVNWAARVVQAGSGAPTVPRRIFRAWTTALRSPSLPVKQQVCAELSRLLDEAVQAVDRAHRAEAGPSSAPAAVRAVTAAGGSGESSAVSSGEAVRLQQAAVLKRLRQCVEILPLERLRSLAERRMLKEGEDEPMLSRALQSIVDLVSSAELALRVLREHDQAAAARAAAAADEGEGKRPQEKADEAIATAESPVVGGTEGVPPPQPAAAAVGRSVLCFPSPAAYVSLQGRDLEPPWTAEFWLLRPNPDGTWEDGDEATGEPAADAAGNKESGGDDDDDDDDDAEEEKEERSCSIRPLELGPSVALAVAAPPRGIRKAFSERLPQPPPATVSMARASSTPSSSVDLTHLPPMDSANGAPSLARTRSADAVGQDEEDGRAAGALNTDEFPPLPRPSRPGAAAGAVGRRSSNRPHQEGRRSPVDAAAAEGAHDENGVFSSFSAAFTPPPPAAP